MNVIHEDIRRVLVFSMIPLLFIACTKIEPRTNEPMPDYDLRRGKCPEYENISGLLCAMLFEKRPYQYYAPDKTTWELHTLALFADPGANLPAAVNLNRFMLTGREVPGLIYFGNVTFNEFPLNWNPGSYSFTPHDTFSLTQQICWRTEGTVHLKGFNTVLQDPFPGLYNDLSQFLYFSRTEGLDFKASDFAENYDSLYLVHQYDMFGSSLAPGKKNITMTAEEIAMAYPGIHEYEIPMLFQGFKYYHARINGRTYQFVFIRATKIPSKVKKVE